MATLKDLYRLVHALDKNEKKNLSLLIEAMGGKAKKRYADSLHIINEQKEFDAEKLKKKLGASVSGMSLSEANDYFYTFICKSLANAQTAATANLGFLKEMILVETFISKGLFDQAARQLHPLLDKLKEGNSFGLLSRGLELHSIICSSNESTRMDYPLRKAILREREQKAKDQLQYLEILKLSQQVDETVQKIGDPRQKSHMQAYEEIYKHPLCHVPYSEISTQAFTMYAPFRTGIVGMIEGNQAAIKACYEALEEFNHRLNFRDHYVVAFYLYDNLVSDCIREGDVKGIQQVIPMLRALLPHAKQRGVAQKIMAKIWFSELSEHLLRGTFAAGVASYEDSIREEHKAQWIEAPLAYMNILLGARLYYMNNEPEKALDQLAELQPLEKAFRSSLAIAYRFLYLLCYYRLSHYSLIASTADSIYKSLLKQEKLYPPERAMLKFVKGKHQPDTIVTQMRTLYDTLLKLSKEPYNESFFQHGDYLKWLDLELHKKRKG
ncbi:MAG: hypothetical protein U0T84_09160 [Chitinophagales bacterium]